MNKKLKKYNYHTIDDSNKVLESYRNKRTAIDDLNRVRRVYFFGDPKVNLRIVETWELEELLDRE